MLIVEDEVAVAQSLARGLKEAGFRADYAVNGDDGLRMAAALPPYDVLILDIGLGGATDGYHVCRQVRARGHASAILMLTARDALADRLAGFDAGADDYLAKPFALEEVLARIRAIVRRRTPQAQGGQLVLGDIRLDVAGRRMVVDDAEVAMTRREFDVMELLMRHPNQVLSKEQIHDALWSHDVTPESGIVEVYVGRVRRRLVNAGANVTVATVRGAGYRLEVEAE